MKAWWDEREAFDGPSPPTPTVDPGWFTPLWRAKRRVKRLAAEAWLSALRRPSKWRRGPEILGLCYHGVVSDGAGPDTCYDPNLVVSESFLKRQLHLVARWFDSVSATSGVEHRGSGGPTRAVVSFDDGLRSVHDLGAAILRETGIQATLYLNDSVIGGGRLWHDKVAASAARLSEARIESVFDALNGERRPILPDWRAGLGVRVAHALKRLSPKRLDEAVDALVEASGATFESRIYMTKAEIRALMDQGHTLGGHSTHHYLLPSLSDARLREEVSGNRAALTEAFGQDVKTFAYPNGDHGPRERRLMSELGLVGAYEVEGHCGYGGAFAMPRRNMCDLVSMDERGRFSGALFFGALLGPTRWADKPTLKDV